MVLLTAEQAVELEAGAFNRKRRHHETGFICHFISGKVENVRYSYHSDVEGLALDDGSTAQEATDAWVAFLQTQTLR